MKLLYAEDDEDARAAVLALLTRNRYSVDTVDNGEDALTYLLGGDYDAAILDIMMPGLSGTEVVKRLRKEGKMTPILMLTAMGELEDRVNGLDAGADDYLTKPFAGAELLARVRALLRRREVFTPDILSFGDLTLDRSSYVLSSGDQSVSLSGKSFQVMEMFLLSPTQIISAEQLMEHIWGWDSEAEINVVWVNISFLRKQLSALNSHVSIKAIRGSGYRLEI